MNAPGWSNWEAGDGPAFPFGEAPPSPDAKADEIPGYVKRFGAYYTLTEGVFLPAGTLLPFGANFALQATLDFGMHFPAGSKVPGGFLLPVSVVKKPPPAPAPTFQDNPTCVIQ
ncbi:hypothetical protein M231_00066 [Tremella mesenterica]|uniref:Uncharacterized protein n=1 Tax=Tremella mesenterica TaxID=5217 RepID=A0A4Q1BWN3_TREME|nr:hypothetical protein M231_00066 [Tremella mesenterica]